VNQLNLLCQRISKSGRETYGCHCLERDNAGFTAQNQYTCKPGSIAAIATLAAHNVNADCIVSRPLASEINVAANASYVLAAARLQLENFRDIAVTSVRRHYKNIKIL
jgi:hypothetical protein